ncbi:MAG: T9SS type A sorting domain-containing protein [Melioribacteraceae bacterium]|nr:T9SS type A sorting domain-containing protein [Melioribacteraceae bacterium]MCF8263444.1 T9SS type A sorting domain-containing protein [Melioribacteraceae bacterium]MCF8432085.1 T9SS type A sorting domain-containing protein [Melioribacteraceae bacterium]
MKKILLNIIWFFVTFPPVIAYSQGWEKIEPIFNPPGVYDMTFGTFVDNDNGWFVEVWNNGRRIWKSTDGGLNWNKVKDSTETARPYDIHFIDKNHGWVSGLLYSYDEGIDTGFVWRTTDGGFTWEENITPKFNKLFFFDSLNGIGGGKGIYGTDDGGRTWHEKNYEHLPNLFVSSVYYFNRDFGWALGSYDYSSGIVLLKTTDGGENWLRGSLPIIGNSLYFTSGEVGWLVGISTEVYKTTDGGNSWNPGEQINNSWLSDIKFVNDSLAWVTGDSGFIGLSTDGGNTWGEIESGTTEPLGNISFVDDNKTGFIFGYNNTLLKSAKTVGIKKNGEYLFDDFHLFQNYPNPFNPSTTIEFTLNIKSNTSVSIYSSSGKQITTLLQGEKAAGIYSLRFNAGAFNLSSGVYYIKLQTEQNSITKKMLYLK